MTDDGRVRRRRILLVAGLVWIALGVVLLVVVGGATGFLPADPQVPQIGFVDAGDGRVAIEVGPTSFAAARGIEIRSGSEAGNGRMLWHIERNGTASNGTASNGTAGTGTRDNGRVVIGTVPAGFRETTKFAGTLPRLWHAEVDNRCYFGSSVVPATLDTELVTSSSGERITPAGFRDADLGFSSCDSDTLGGRAAAFAGLVSIAIGGVLIVACWWDVRRGLPAELTEGTPG